MKLLALVLEIGGVFCKEPKLKIVTMNVVKETARGYILEKSDISFDCITTMTKDKLGKIRIQKYTTSVCARLWITEDEYNPDFHPTYLWGEVLGMVRKDYENLEKMVKALEGMKDNLPK